MLRARFGLPGHPGPSDGTTGLPGSETAAARESAGVVIDRCQRAANLRATARHDPARHGAT
jgi:hypothetical protein